jgi:hypothetical protein
MATQTRRASSSPHPAEKEWTLLFYNAGHADESKMCTASLLDLDRVGTDESTHVVVMNHRSAWLPERMLGVNQDHNGTRSYAIEARPMPAGERKSDARTLLDFALSSPSQVRSAEIERHPDDTNMGDPATLKKFLLDNMARYPARHYALFVSGHGAAFGGQAIVHGPEGRIRNEQLAAVLDEVRQESGRRLAMVNLNTCFGANLETVYPLRGVADAVVASEGTIFAGTQAFGRVLADIRQASKEGVDLSGPDLARLCVEESRRQPLGNVYSETLSAIDLSRIDSLASSVDKLYGALIDQKVPPATLREAWAASQRVDYSSVPRQVYVTDLGSFAERIAEKVENVQVREAAGEVRKALARSILARTHPEPLRESLTTTALRRLLGRPLEENAPLSGLTTYLDDEAEGPNGRMDQIKKTEFGASTRAAELLAYMGSEKEKSDATLLGRLEQKHALLAQKITHLTHVPKALAIAERIALGGAMLTTFHALNAIGIPAYAYGFGTYFTVRGAVTAARGLTQAMPAEPLARRRALIDAGTKLALGAATTTFGLYLLGALPSVVAWPAAFVAGGVRVGQVIANVLAATPERREILADDRRFQDSSIASKVYSTETFAGGKSCRSAPVSPPPE